MRNLKFVLFFSMLFYFGCQKENIDTSEINTNSIEKEALLNVAKSLSKALENPEVNQFIIENSILKQNGEYEFLYALTCNDKVFNNLSFAQVLDKYDDSNDLFYYQNKIIEYNPLLSIFVYTPIGFDLTKNTKIGNEIFANTLDDDLDEKSLIPYYKDGVKDFQLSGLIPNNASLVIKENERIVVKKEGDNSNYYLPLEKLGSIYDLNFHKIISKKAVPYDEYVESLTDNNIEIRTVQRDNYPNKWDGVQRILFKKNLENWFTGGPELRISAQTVNDLSITQPWDLPSSDKNDWVLIDAQFVIWSQEPGLPSRMKYSFTEADGTKDHGKFKLGLSAEVNIPFIGSVKVSPEYTFGDDKDDLYGECFEYYTEWVDPTTWGNDHQVGSNFIAWMNIID